VYSESIGKTAFVEGALAPEGKNLPEKRRKTSTPRQRLKEKKKEA